ncbi:MAG: HAMP domain-containing histidine kinase [Sphingobacteriales bacterium]|nr:HAMP domain-containing histidine kinase [Sphingobacteriales bacterium]
MFRQVLSWKTVLALIAIAIVISTIFYTRYLANKIAKEERQKVEEWVEAGRFLFTSPPDADTRLPLKIIRDNENDVPVIETNERDSIISFINLDSAKAETNKSYLEKRLRQFKSLHEKPIEWTDPKDPSKINRYYYGESRLLKEVRYYPIVQLCIVALFIAITIFSIRSSYRSVQNQVWAGMAKETAHQLGTPVSSLEGWVEMLKEKSESQQIAHELEKDVDRLRLISDRFGKIGSTPQLEEVDIINQVNIMVDYMRKRATGKINFSVNSHGKQAITALVSAPLFDWVIENLLKNSLDAMEGKGSITADITEDNKKVFIDITDTGKGISRQNIPLVFKPGFTTKKRGWGLGLSLSKRIIQQYHRGEIFVKHSDPGKGTTFRIVLKK